MGSVKQEELVSDVGGIGDIVSGEGEGEGEGDMPWLMFMFMPVDGGLTAPPELTEPLHRKGNPALLLVAIQKLFHSSQPVIYISKHAWLRDTARSYRDL